MKGNWLQRLDMTFTEQEVMVDLLRDRVDHYEITVTPEGWIEFVSYIGSYKTGPFQWRKEE